MRRSLVIRWLGLLFVVMSITFVACGPVDTGPQQQDGGRRDAGDNPPMSGVP